tara:strand:- start:4828 stop:6243 length:1416 start_codon:yes stop_codon:yes gene_type:complete
MEKNKLNRRVFAQVAGAGAAAITLARSQAAEQEKSKPVWSAGAAETEADIPAEGTFLIGPMQKSDGQNDPLFIRALVLTDGQTKLAIVSNDLLGFDFEFNDRLVDAIHQKTGIPKQQIMINCSHNHNSPLTIPWSEQWEKAKDKPWHQTLPGQFAEVVAEADSRLQPVTARYRREPTQISVNRRMPVAHGMTMAPNPDGDQMLWVDAIHLKTIAEDKPVGVLYSYAAHPVIVHSASRKISADYPGFASERIRQAMNGGKAPPEGETGGIPMFIQGCGGDINGAPLASGIGAARGAGRDLGYAVVRALRKEPQPLEGRLRFAYREIDLPLQDPPSVEKCKKLIADRPHHGPYRELLAIAEAGKPRFLKMPLQAFALGDDLCILGMSHEPFAAYQLQGQEESPFAHTLILGYTNGCENYLATAEAYRMGDRGGYEASPFGAAMMYKHRLACKPEVEAQMLAAMNEVLREAHQA